MMIDVMILSLPNVRLLKLKPHR